MSNAKHETIADIVREIRQAEVTWHRSEIAQLPTQYLKEWADRIEAAHKRESEAGAEAAQICGEIGELIGREATTEKSSRVGNADAVRDIAQEMLNTSMQDITAERINGWAMRLAAACEQTVTNCNQLGNAAAMRKALVQVSRIAVEMTRKTITGEPEDRKTVDRWALRLCDIACDAISAPPRNCDVGTAEEQEARFNKFCFSYYNINNVDGECNTCPLNDNVKTTCEFAWMQMPYEEGEAE